MARVVGTNFPLHIRDMSSVGMMKQRGLWARLDLRAEMTTGGDWWPYPPHPGMAATDAALKTLVDNQVRFLPILFTGELRQPHLDAARMNKWLDYVRFMVRRYPWWKQVQLFNEPNMHASSAGGGFADSAAWERFLRTTVAAVKQIAPNMQTIAGAIAVGSRRYDVANDLRTEWFKAGARTCDRVAVNTYSRTAWGALRAIRHAEDIANNYGKHAWVTEFGMDSAEHGEARQRDWLKAIIAGSGSRPLFYFTGSRVNNPTWPADLSLLRADWSGKPAWYELCRAAA